MVVAHPFEVTTGPNTTTRILLSSSFPAPLLPRLALETLLATALDATASPRQLREAMAASSASAFTAATFSSPASFAASPTTTSPPTTTGPNTTTRILLSSSSFPAPLLSCPALETLLATALDAAASPRQLCEAHGRILRLGLHGSNFLVTRLLRRLADHRIPTHPLLASFLRPGPLPKLFPLDRPHPRSCSSPSLRLLRRHPPHSPLRCHAPSLAPHTAPIVHLFGPPQGLRHCLLPRHGNTGEILNFTILETSHGRWPSPMSQTIIGIVLSPFLLDQSLY